MVGLQVNFKEVHMIKITIEEDGQEPVVFEGLEQAVLAAKKDDKMVVDIVSGKPSFVFASLVAIKNSLTEALEKQLMEVHK